MQLYVFVSRAAAYPFNAKQPTDMTKRQLKVTKQQLESLQQRFQVLLSSLLIKNSSQIKVERKR